jgi:hypothetical protein
MKSDARGTVDRFLVALLCSAAGGDYALLTKGGLIGVRPRPPRKLTHLHPKLPDVQGLLAEKKRYGWNARCPRTFHNDLPRLVIVRDMARDEPLQASWNVQ